MTRERLKSSPERLWLLGAHGGAGIGSLIRAGVPGVDAEGAWPICRDGAQVLVVCRSHASGLAAAREAAAEVALGKNAPAGVQLVGLVVVNDGPKLTWPLRADRTITAGGYPRAWYVPWVEEWRHDAAGPLTAPPVVRDLTTELLALTGDQHPQKETA